MPRGWSDLRRVVVGLALALLAGCGDGDGSDCSGESCLHVIRNQSPGPLCYNIGGAPSTGCPTPTPSDEPVSCDSLNSTASPYVCPTPTPTPPN